MSRRDIPLITDHYYHVFNRGVNRQPVFFEKRDYEQYLLGVNYYRFAKPPVRLSHFKNANQEQRRSIIDELEKNHQPLVDILSFVLMPNHVHFLLHQNQDGGISTFISKITNSYTKYCNTKHERIGHLFQGSFKAIRMETNEQIVHVSRYIHLNPTTAYLVPETGITTYLWSSLPRYIDNENSGFINPALVLSHFSSRKQYLQFILDQADYAKKLADIKHLTLEK